MVEMADEGATAAGAAADAELARAAALKATATAHHQQGEYAEAIAAYDEALQCYAEPADPMDPENPDQVSVSRPSDALEAQEAAEVAFTNLLLGLGSVALLVGGVAIANVMIMSVLERRMEIGVRRSIGATRKEIRYQFLLESILLSGVGDRKSVV